MNVVASRWMMQGEPVVAVTTSVNMTFDRLRLCLCISEASSSL